MSLKDAGGESFEDAYGLLQSIISQLYVEHAYLEKCAEIDGSYKEIFTRLKRRQGNKTDVQISLRILICMMQIYYGKQVILLIDEYDVPLAKAHENGYYDKMVLLIRNLFGNALKTNTSLAFAVLTGCLRIAKESIFTGLNNFKVYSITNVQFDETFGFTDTEVKEIPGVFTGGDCATGPSTVIRAIAAGKVAAHNIDEYLGYHHTLTCEAVVPEPKENMRDLMGRTEIGERPANIRKKDFEHVEELLTHEEAMQEACRCLRCDHFGCGAMVGGRDL